MSRQTWQETLIASSTDGPALTNSTTQASIIPTDCKLVLPANYFQVGTAIKVTAQGRISNVVTTPGTLLFQVLFGATAVFNNAAAAMNLNVVAKTNVTWWLEILMTCRSVGSGSLATMMGIGQWTSESVVGAPAASAGGSGSLFIPPSAPAVGSGFDSTVAQTLDLQAKFSVSTATTSLQTHEYKVESLN
jgi:hypothetical protein